MISARRFTTGTAADIMTTEEKLSAVLDGVDKILPPMPCVRVTPLREKVGVFDSKLGGVPYLPKGFPYPTVREGIFEGRPLMFLAQLNFAQLPHIPDFPEKGILQFYCGCEGDDVVGVDFEQPFNQNRFRIIYHENVIEDKSQLISENDMPKFDTDECWAFPLLGEFLLKAAEPDTMSVTYSDYRFDGAVTECYNRVCGTEMAALHYSKQGESIYHCDREFINAAYNKCDVTASLIGGYPYFTQDDPRNGKPEFSDIDVVLFQLDSEWNGDGDLVMWGDSGVGNFLISRADLINRDFSRVLYNWDCG